jgi:ribosomal protein S18 acetylase RimI-like enzyme
MIAEVTVEARGDHQGVAVIRQAREEDLPGMVDVHVRSFTGYFLTQLGRSVLTDYYRQFILTDGAIVVVVDFQGRVCGLIAGSSDDDRVLRQFYKRKFMLIFGNVLKQILLLNPTVWRGIADRFIHVRKAVRVNLQDSATVNSVDNGIHKARLVSIAMDPDFQGSGFSGAMLNHYEAANRAAGFSFIRLSVNSDNHRAIRFYEKCGWRIFEDNGLTAKLCKDI